MISGVCHILGNGPSAALIDHARLCKLGISTVGMNAAYRHWREIGFHPTYYICMDATVARSHAAEIRELVLEGKIRRFFLQEEVLKDVPDLAGRPEIQWFGEVHNVHPLFRTEFVTTGSWAIRWAAAMGYSTLVLSGIDSLYVDQLPEARAKRELGELGLVIDATPGYNPNYFFAGYQQAGDEYNLPNDPAYLQSRGGLVHVDALHAVREDLLWCGYRCTVFDTSPLSYHGAFGKKSLSSVYQNARFWCATWLDASDRNAGNEVARALLENLENPWVDGVRLMVCGDWEGFLQTLPGECERGVRSFDGGKLHTEARDDVPCFGELLAVANKQRHAADDIGKRGLVAVIPPGVIVGEDVLREVFLWFLEYPLDALFVPKGGREILFVRTETHLTANPEGDGLRSSRTPTGLRAIWRTEGREVRTLREKDAGDGGSRSSFAGAVDAAELAAFRDAVFRRYACAGLVRTALEQAEEMLENPIAWFGPGGTSSPWEALMHAAGIGLPASRRFAPRLVFHKISLTPQDLEHPPERLDQIFALREREIPFIEWECSGFGTPLGLPAILSRSGWNELSQFFLKHPLQSLVHVNHAESAQRKALDTLVLVARDLLLAGEGFLSPSDYGGTGHAIGAGGAQKPGASVCDTGDGVAVRVPMALSPGDAIRVEVRFSFDLPGAANLRLVSDGDGQIEETNRPVHWQAGFCCEMIDCHFQHAHPAMVLEWRFPGAGEKAPTIGELRARIWKNDVLWSSSQLDSLECRREESSAGSSDSGGAEDVVEFCDGPPSADFCDFLRGVGIVARGADAWSSLESTGATKPAVRLCMYSARGGLREALDLFGRFGEREDVTLVFAVFPELPGGPHSSGVQEIQEQEAKVQQLVQAMQSARARVRILAPSEAIATRMQRECSLGAVAWPLPCAGIGDAEFLRMGFVEESGVSAKSAGPLLVSCGGISSNQTPQDSLAATLLDGGCGTAVPWQSISTSTPGDREFQQAVSRAAVVVFPERANAVTFDTLQSLLTAMFLRTPVVVAEGTPLAEIVRTRDCGLVVEPSPEAFRQAVREISSDYSAWFEKMNQARLGYFLENSHAALAAFLADVLGSPDAVGRAREKNLFAGANDLLREKQFSDAIPRLLFLHAATGGEVNVYFSNVLHALRELPVFRDAALCLAGENRKVPA